ncbi:MAG: alginate lyase family protein [Pseudomonadota bacterium]
MVLSPNRFRPNAMCLAAIATVAVFWIGALGLTNEAHAQVATCAAPPMPVVALDLKRYYADRSGTIVDAKLKRAYEAETDSLRQYLRTVTRRADRAWTKTKRDERQAAARCGLLWLHQWAEGGALLGKMATKQAEYRRKWEHTGLALAYLKLRPFATPDQHAAIANWLTRLARASEQFQMAPGRKPNNHLYWLALGLGATAIATDNALMWARTEAIVERAAQQIDANGALPLEMARGRRALHYHVFALMPLVVLGELGFARGRDWYALNGAAFHRLVGLTVEGIKTPATFDQLARRKQSRPINRRAGWAWIYAKRFPEAKLPATLTDKRRHRLLGGDVAVLVRVLERLSAR